MGMYRHQVLPRMTDHLCGASSATPLRRKVCQALFGEVVEVGFGSGLNVPFYPAAVSRVAAIEPADVAWKLAAGRLAASPMPVQRFGLDAQTLPFDDHTFDCALSTWTMCTIPDVETALAEVRRVLRPGGTLHFVEHGLAPDESVARWQQRIEPLQARLFGGCQLTRPIVDLVRRAGFGLLALDAFYQEGSPKVMGAATLGVAVA